MFSRFLADYGIIFVLLAVCAFFSVATLDEQHPTGASAGAELGEDIARQTRHGATVFIAVRDTQEDTGFATALEDELNLTGRRVIGTTRGQPAHIRQALIKVAEQGKRLDAVASLQAVGVEAILDSLKPKYPTALAQTRLFVPQSYTWPNFLKASNLLNITFQIAVIAIIGIGMTMVIIAGGIDLSVGSLMALAAVLAAVIIRDVMGGYEATGSGMLVACLIAIAVCGLVGFVTGVVVTGFGVPAFIVTLSMMLIASGLALSISKSESIGEMPDSFMWLGRGTDLGLIPNAVVLMAILYVIAHIIMSRTVLGRYIYAVGGNAEAARLSGVPVARVVILVYVVTDMLAGLGGVILASQLKGSNPNYGILYELYVIAAVVVGGSSLSGGEGKIFGTLLGAFLIAVIQNGMNLTGVDSNNQKIVLGVVILVAVLLDKGKKGGWGLRRLGRSRLPGATFTTLER
jgi:ribose/xylose/arabinose/galactoside ABC-type transport system permease subunit